MNHTILEIICQNIFQRLGKILQNQTVAFVPKLSFCLTRQAFKGINNEDDTRHRILASGNICAFFFLSSNYQLGSETSRTFS